MDDQRLLKLEENLEQLTSTSLGRRAFLTSMPVLLAGCSTSAKTQHRYREGDNSGQSTDMTISDEIQAANEYGPKLLKEYPPVRNIQAQRYIQNLGDKLARQSRLEGNPYNYEFMLVNAKMVNAFALPAGKVYVTTPLLKLANSEAELAGVIGHEIGHVKARHSAERMQQAKDDQTKSLIYGLGGALLGGAAGYGVGRLLCSKQDRECLARVAQYGVMAGGAGGLLISKFGFFANSREDEMEADRIGYQVAYQSGYHRDYIGKFYWRLKEMEAKNRNNRQVMSYIADAVSTHPPSDERIQQMRSMMAANPIRGKKISSREFEDIKRLV